MRGHRKLAVLACSLLLLVTACGRTDTALLPNPVASLVRVGYSDMTPDYVVAKLYVAALQLKGVPARLDRIESRQAADGARHVDPEVAPHTAAISHQEKLRAIRTGLVDVVPEYTSQLLYAMNPAAPILHTAAQRDTASPDADFDPVFTEMTRSLPQEARSLQPAPAERTMVVAVRAKNPRTDMLRNYSELADRCGRFTILLHLYPADVSRMKQWAQMVNGRYRCTPHDVIVRTGVTSGDNVLLTMATDPLLLSGEWRVLRDDLRAVSADHIFPLVAKSAIDRPRQLIFDELSEKLTTTDVAEMLRIEYNSPDQLDRFIDNWLRVKGFTARVG